MSLKLELIIQAAEVLAFPPKQFIYKSRPAVLEFIISKFTNFFIKLGIAIYMTETDSPLKRIYHAIEDQRSK